MTFMPRIDSMSCADVAAWMKTTFPEATVAAGCVKREDIDGAVLSSMTEEDLEKYMKVKSFGLRRRIFLAIQRLSTPPRKTATQVQERAAGELAR